ncbi:MAG TPA: TPM domain-containing protein [Flavipsychrobacter sp.]|nr:TPM domain-containing protein [Flavipsychrobacter sp.]
MSRLSRVFNFIHIALLAMCLSLPAFAQEIPGRPSPPRLVNDFAHMLATDEVQRLEAKLVEFDNTSSVQIAIVTVARLDNYEVSDYAVKLFNKWGIGQKGKENGVLLLVAKEERKAWIATGRGVEGVMTDAKSGQIYRNEIVPAFKEGNYYKGLSDAADAIIAVTKGEYKNDKKAGRKEKGIPFGTIAFVILIIIVAAIRGGGGNNRGGRYMSGRGAGDLVTGMLLGSLLGGGGHSRGGGGFGGGGFGGFGGGSSGGGGAGGSW